MRVNPFKVDPVCARCNKLIEGGESVHIEMRYPETDGMTRIRKYLEMEAKITCQKCEKVSR